MTVSSIVSLFSLACSHTNSFENVVLKFNSALCAVFFSCHRSKRLLVGLVEYMQLQDVMAWLSTLGGAYSAMGEHLNSYVSTQQ